MEANSRIEALPFQPGDAEWVADLFETFHAGDLDAAVTSLENLLELMRRAAKARRMLADVEPNLLRQGLVTVSRRREGAA
jgi:hypothetical protein